MSEKSPRGCPSGCWYAAREEERQNPKPQKPIYTSTRSGVDVDAQRDMDGFDVNEELAQLRLALRDPRFENSAGLRDLARDLFANIDEWIVRGGPLPRSWGQETEADLCAMLSDFCGEAGASESALETLARLVAEVRAGRPRCPAAKVGPPAPLGEHLFTLAAGDVVLRAGKPWGRNAPGAGGDTKWMESNPDESGDIGPTPPAVGDVITRGGAIVARAVPDAERGRRGFSWEPWGGKS